MLPGEPDAIDAATRRLRQGGAGPGDAATLHHRDRALKRDVALTYSE